MTCFCNFVSSFSHNFLKGDWPLCVFEKGIEQRFHKVEEVIFALFTRANKYKEYVKQYKLTLNKTEIKKKNVTQTTIKTELHHVSCN